MKTFTFLFLFISSITTAYSQVGYGFTASYDIYQYFANPVDDTGESRSAGSALLNFGVGPKLWFGGQDVSFSVEAQANLGLLGFSAADYKGLGVMSVPVMGQLNFAGQSGFDKELRFGWSIGGGIQYNRTELFHVSNSFEDKGGARNWYRTYIGQIGYGASLSGVVGKAFVRFGYDQDTKACNASFGIQTDFNLQKTKLIDDPASRL